MPAAFDLRPLFFGDHIGRAFSMFMRQWVPLARWYAPAFLLPAVVLTAGLHSLLQPYAWVATHSPEPSVFDANAVAAYFWLVRALALAMAQWLAAAGVLFMAARMYVGEEPVFRATARAVWRRALPLTGVTLVHLLALSAILLVCFGPAWAMAESPGRNSSFWGVVIGIFCSAPAAALAAVLYLGRFGLAHTCVMLDDADTAGAFARSAHLSRGFRWRLGMLWLVMAFLTGVPGLWSVLDIPGLVGRKLVFDAGWPLGGDMLHLGWQALLGPVLWLPLVVFYFDQRSRKEGYDLAVMARSFGIDEGELLRFSMDSRLGYVPKGFRGERRHRPLPVAAPVTAWPGVAQPNPWPQAAPWPKAATQAAPQPVVRPRVFRPPQRRSGP